MDPQFPFPAVSSHLKRANPPSSTSASPEERDENVPPFSESGDNRISKDHSAMSEPQKKRSRRDEPPLASEPLPGLQLRVREGSIADRQQSGFQQTNSFNSSSIAARRSSKIPSLNITIAPFPPAQGLSPSAVGPEVGGDPVTPLLQIVHTPTIAPGAPGPGDPAEQRRLEKCWANSTGLGNQFSPAFPPPSFDLNGLMANLGQDCTHGTSAALREMFALTASAQTPTFPPDSFSLDFAKLHDSEMSDGKGGHSQ